LCSSHFLLSKSYFQHLKILIAFAKFKAKFDANILFFQICHFLCMPKYKLEGHNLYITTHDSALSHITALFPVGNESPDYCCLTYSSRSLC
jgi:hypothetical protein